MKNNNKKTISMGTSALISIAKQKENEVKNVNDNSGEEKIETKPDPSVYNITEIQLQEEIKKDTTSYIFDFEKCINKNKDYGIGDANIRLPLSLHKRIKLVAAHTGIPIARIISNVVDEFLNLHEKQVNKVLRS